MRDIFDVSKKCFLDEYNRQVIKLLLSFDELLKYERKEKEHKLIYKQMLKEYNINKNKIQSDDEEDDSKTNDNQLKWWMMNDEWWEMKNFLFPKNCSW